MGVTKRGETWHYRFVYKGRIYSGNTYLGATAKNRKAAKKIEEREREKARGGMTRQSVDFASGASLFLSAVQRELKPEAHRRLRTSMAVLARFFKKAMVEDIVAADVDDFKADRRRDKIAEVTIRHDLHALSRMLQYGRKHGWLEGDPMDGVVMPSDKDSVRERVVTPEEEAKYFAEVAKYKRSALHDVAKLVLLTGMRPGEVYRLEWRDVDLDSGKLTVRESKSKAGRRTLRLVKEAREILNERMETATNDNTAPDQYGRRTDGVSGLSRRDHPSVVSQGGRRQGLREDALGSGAPASRYVFPSPKRPGKPLSRLTVSHQEAIKRAGVDFQLYDLRRTFGTRMAAAGVSPHVLSKIMGHSSLKVTMRHYVHAQPEEEERAFELYEEARKER